MKPYDSDEELERALFSLELEEPPADLRESILAGTIYRPPLPFKLWEVWALGALCAVMAWVAVLAARGDAAPAFETFQNAIGTGLAAFSQPQTLFWTALGGGMVLWISQLNLTPAAGALRVTRR